MLACLVPKGAAAHDISYYKKGCFSPSETADNSLIPDNSSCSVKAESISDGSLKFSFIKYFYKEQNETTYALVKAGKDAEVLFSIRMDNSMAAITNQGIIKNRFGHFLLLVEEESGTADFHEYDLYKIENGKLLQVDTRHIIADIKKILPPNHAVWKGPFLDFVGNGISMISPVWNTKTDANCCPTGGTLSVTFEYKDQRLYIDKFSYDPLHTDGS